MGLNRTFKHDALSSRRPSTSLFSLTVPVPVLVCEALSSFSVLEVVRSVRLKEGLLVLELFHGQTLAFKDLAMTCTVHFLNYFLQKDNCRATVLVGKTGTTVIGGIDF